MATIRDIVIDCRHAPSIARFWASALDGYAVRPYDDEEVARLAGLGLTPATDPNVAVDGPGSTLFFQQVPEGKVVKNRVHLELLGGTPDEIARLLALGATVYAEFDGHVVLQDPEGNEFCVMRAS